MVARAEYHGSRWEQASPRRRPMNGTVPAPAAPLNDDQSRHYWSAAPSQFCSASSTIRSCACYCPRSGYAFDWLANAVQQQATTVLRLEDKVDRLAILLETALVRDVLPAGSARDGHCMPLNDGSEAGESAASSQPSSAEPQSTASNADKSRVQPKSSQETVSFAAAESGADSLPLRLSKFLKLATSSAANGLVGAHYPSGSSPPLPSDDYDRLSTTSHDDHDDSTCESDEDGFGDEGERDEDPALDGSTSFEARTAAVWSGRPGRPIDSWLESVE